MSYRNDETILFGVCMEEQKGWQVVLEVLDRLVEASDWAMAIDRAEWEIRRAEQEEKKMKRRRK